MIKELILFTDGSVNPQLKIGCGSYLFIEDKHYDISTLPYTIKTKKFEDTSSTKAELQTLLWALNEIELPINYHLTIYTDSQNIIGLPNRREHFEKNNYSSKKNALIANHELYKQFYIMIDSLHCTLVKVQGHKVESEKDAIDELFTLVDRSSRDTLRSYF
jgi:ribonuclease HI